MNFRFIPALLAAGGLAAASPASAQSVLDGTGGRYQMQPVEGGIARLDTVTGAVDLCRVAGDAITCKTTSVLGQSDTQRLADLEARVAALEDAGSAVAGEDATEQAIKTMRQVFRGFADIVRELEKDLRSDPNGVESETEPDRT